TGSEQPVQPSLKITSSLPAQGSVDVQLTLPPEYSGKYVLYIINPDSVSVPVSSGALLGTRYYSESGKNATFTAHLGLAQAHEGFASNQGGVHWFPLPSGRYHITAVVYPSSPFRPGTDMEYLPIGTEPAAIKIADSSVFELVNNSQPVSTSVVLRADSSQIQSGSQMRFSYDVNNAPSGSSIEMDLVNSSGITAYPMVNRYLLDGSTRTLDLSQRQDSFPSHGTITFTASLSDQLLPIIGNLRVRVYGPNDALLVTQQVPMSVLKANSSSSITVTSVVPISQGNLVNVQFSNLTAGWNVRIIGVNGASQSLPVSSSSLLPVSGGYSGNQVANYTVPASNQNFTAITVPYSAPAGSYVLEVSNPSAGWATLLRTPPFSIGKSSPSGGITVTAPNGGEAWLEGVINSVTWTPYQYGPDINPSRDVTAYLEVNDCGSKSNPGPECFRTLGKVEESGKASIHWVTGELNSATTGGNLAPPGVGYYIRVVNNVTGATDRSDAPFVLLPKPVDLKINGSDGPLNATAGTPLTATWTGTGSVSCRLDNAYDAPTPTAYPVPAFQNLPLSGSRTIYVPQQQNWYVNIACLRQDGSTLYDTVVVNASGAPASLQITSPNGGEKLSLNSKYTINWNQKGLSTVAIALYKNDQWQSWINKEVLSDKSANDSYSYVWQTPSEAQTDGNVYKIYITGQKADGTGYVDDKSDATFGFAGAQSAVGNVIVGGGTVSPSTLGFNSTNTTLGTYVLTAGANEDIILNSLRFTIRAVSSTDTSRAGTDITNLKVVVNSDAYPVSTVSSGLYSTYSVTIPSVRIPKSTSLNLYIRGDIVGSRGGTVDLWSDKGDFSFVGASSQSAIVPSSSNSTNDNNYYWSGWLSVNASPATPARTMVVGVYQGTYPSGISSSFGVHPEATVNVKITGDGSPSATPVILVLTSYEPENWIIDNSFGAKIQKVITSGYYAQRVTGLSSSIPVESHSLDTDGVYKYAYQYGDANYNSLVAWMSSQGLPIPSSFSGGYTGSAFNIYTGDKGSAYDRSANLASSFTALQNALKFLQGLVH
ncbi:hypothetical protein K8R04_03115, partial [Candidatus Uhrbacteria bacterium]|nr:hypothetical protein [Candidatus Uhrbacteria bacterium]